MRLWIVLVVAVVACGGGGPGGGGKGGGAAGSAGAGGGSGIGGTGGAPGAGEVACGTNTCTLSTQAICCIDAQSPAVCTPLNNCGDGKIVARCDGPEECPNGQACCYNIGDVHSFLQCTLCDVASQVCHGDTDCPDGAVCCGVAIGGMYRMCKMGACD